MPNSFSEQPVSATWNGRVYNGTFLRARRPANREQRLRVEGYSEGQGEQGPEGSGPGGADQHHQRARP
jgi:hypothetical protein